jgi:hypothetical protein
MGDWDGGGGRKNIRAVQDRWLSLAGRRLSCDPLGSKCERWAIATRAHHYSKLCFTGVFVTTVVQRTSRVKFLNMHKLTMPKGPRGSNVGLTDEQRAALTPEQTKPMVEGSKAILAALYIYATGLWSMKGQMLFLYHRLT